MRKTTSMAPSTKEVLPRVRAAVETALLRAGVTAMSTPITSTQIAVVIEPVTRNTRPVPKAGRHSKEKAFT
jgi:hypothetical protein